ncbi:MAG: hypothetical protein LQ347_004737, partial [Umbilicaria vellea]
GRTAWSSTVTINQTNISARYWYDGQYVNNAKEDAAEVALQHLLTNSNSPSPISPISPQSQNSMHQGSIWGSAGAGRPQQGAFFGGREGRERAWTRGISNLFRTAEATASVSANSAKPNPSGRPVSTLALAVRKELSGKRRLSPEQFRVETTLHCEIRTIDAGKSYI